MRKVFSGRAPVSLAAMSLLTLFSCSIPFFGKGRNPASNDNSKRMATVSGVLDYKNGCEAGYYKVVLKGMFENSGVQIETQTDVTGRFEFIAPPGKYLALVNKGQCGTKETVELEKNTEHMFSFAVQETLMEERVEEASVQGVSRLPASLLIYQNK
jgi:hypothetical protein